MSDNKAVPEQPLLDLSRRKFLKGSTGLTFAIGASGFISALGVAQGTAAFSSNPGEALQANMWVTITPANTVIVKYAGTEMGQGSMTHVPVMLAEHLDADWDKVEVDIIKKHDMAYGNPVFQNMLYTAGSTHVAVYGGKMKMAGAQARKLLMLAVAEDWGVELSSLTTEPSLVVHAASGRKINYGDIVGTMALPTEAPAVDKSEFKSESAYRYIGQSVMRRDVPAKSNGTEQYGMDVQVAGMAYAAIKRAPVEGERPLKVIDTEARKVKGITDIVTLPYGVAIVGNTVEGTKKAKALLQVTWSETSPFRQKSSDTALEEYAKNAKDLSISGPAWILGKGKAKETLAAADNVLEALYTSDAAYHAQMEPLNATASVSKDGKSAEIWVGTQTQSLTILGSAETLGTTEDKITLHPLTMGGSFGRRSELHQQFIDDALLVSKALKRPIKVIWSREDDLEAGAFRTAAAQFLRGAFDKEGNLLAVHHRVSAPEVLPTMNKLRWETVKPRDVIAMMGSENSTYDIPNHLPEHVVQDRCSRVIAYRGIATSYTKFAMESFIDELAHTQDMDPLAFRLKLCRNNPRMTKVLETVAEMADWGRPREKGVGLGLAISGYHKSLSAGIVELTVDSDSGAIHINKYWGVGDAGRIISPRNAQAQLLSNIIFGLSSALKEKVEIKNGIVQQTNFHNFNILRMNEVPDIDCKMTATNNHSTGVGELGMAMTAPSIANAIFSITGKRIRHMPLRPEVVSAALKS